MGKKSYISSNYKLQKTDDQILDERINANVLIYPKKALILVALIVSFQPLYFSHAINSVDWKQPLNILLYAVITGFTSYLLTKAYGVMVQSEFWSRQKHFAEGSSDRDASLLRQLRLQLAIAYSLFFINTTFFVLNSIFIGYLFRTTDPRAAYVLSPSLTAALLWFVAQKNEESRRRRLTSHR